ncbi:hypothetical protein R1flu_017354 [Riccia fluitans]|uniref:Ubiquitin-like protease family profile domain-containing protein n=1 Tax=Riccia fluitans TaxID=41844 RepID=A0ABD1ZE01_9MARC
MDGKLVEPFDPDELERPRKIVRSNSSKKSDVPLPPNAGAEEPTPRKGKEKMAMQPENEFKDEVRKELRELKEAITMSRQEAEAIARSQKETTTHLGQSSAGPSNHMEGTDVRRGQPAASLQTPSASMAEYRNTVARMLEECERAIERNTSLEEELVIAERKIDKLKQRVKDRNVVDVAIENAERRLILTTVHKILSEWRVDNLLLGTSFITGHRLLASDVDRVGIETSYLSICNDFKLEAASHRSPQLFYEHLKSIFDSYVNPDNNPDVQPLVRGLDAEDFDVVAFLGTNMGGRKEEMTPDFQDGLFVHDVRRLESEIENIRGEPQWVARATARLRLNYEQDVLPPPITEENITDSTVVPTVGCSTDLTTDEAVDEPCSPPDRQIISVVPSQRVDQTAVVSPKANRCPSRSPSLDFCADPWKVPLVIGAHPTSRNNMHSDALDRFPGIHKKEYIFHVLRTFLRLTMPICPDTIVCGTMEVFDATKLSRFSISVDRAISMVEENANRSHSNYLSCMFVSLQVPHQLDQYSCGIHIIQMLAGVGMKGLGLDQCWRVEKLA